MKKVLLSIFLVLILSSCSIDWNGEKDQKIVKLEKQVEELKKEKENDLFKKKQECSNKMIEITKNMANYKSSIGLKFELENIFYSPSLNECLYIDYMIDNSEKIKRVMKYGSNVGGEPIESCVYSSNYEIPNYNKCDDFNNKIKELKGE